MNEPTESWPRIALIGGIDVDKAAEEAVSTDGAAHFLCSYDGNYDLTKPSGFVVWRHN